MSTGLRLSVGQNLKQTQKAAISQRTIQSLNLLQLPLQQLEERIAQELETNPVLDLEPNLSDSEILDSDERSEFDDSSFPSEQDDELNVGDEARNGVDDFNTADEFASLYSDTIDEQPTRSQDWLENESSRLHDLFGNVPANDDTLQNHLLEQLYWFDLTPEIRSKCEQIIDRLDENGFLLCSIEDLTEASLTELPATFVSSESDDVSLASDQTTQKLESARVSDSSARAKESSPSDRTSPSFLEEKRQFEKALAIVQNLDPLGIGARNIQESLLLQVRPGSPLEEEVRTLIKNHWEDLGNKNYAQISQKTGFSQEQIQDALLEIGRLNPRPGSVYFNQPIPAIVPDVYVERAEDGSWNVWVNNKNCDGLSINSDYIEMLKDKSADRTTKEYLRQNIGSARQLIDQIKMRNSTLLRVAREIMAYQKDFLEEGVSAIRSLTMRQIADQLDCDPSTVSRTCKDKWVQTPQGIFPFKRFFRGSLEATGDGQPPVSQDDAHLKLQRLIDGEDKNKPYSDAQLSLLMEREGVKIARKTVQKYRNELQIPTQRERKTQKINPKRKTQKIESGDQFQSKRERRESSVAQ